MNELVLVVGCVRVDERGGTASFSTVTTLLSPRDALVPDWPAATANDVNLSYGVTFVGFFTSLLLLRCLALLPPGLMLCLPFNDMMNPSSFRVASSLVAFLLTGRSAIVSQGVLVLLESHHLDTVFCTSSLLQCTYDGQTGTYKVY